VLRILPTTPSVEPARNEHPGLFRAGEGDEVEEWLPTSVTPVVVRWMLGL